MMRIALALVVLGVAGIAPATAAAADTYVLPFIAMPNAPGGAAGGGEGTMKIVVENGKSTVRLKVRGLYPHTVYTIWTVFNHLAPGMEMSTSHAPPSCSANGSSSNPRCPSGWKGWDGFHMEGNGVAPTAKISARFTDGMGLDPGATFVTNARGDGDVTVRLDFDITSEAPIGNKDITVQCAPTPGVIFKADPTNPAKIEKACADPRSKVLRVTTTWLREYIGQVMPKQATPALTAAMRAAACANYESEADPDVVGDSALADDARLWQCVDPKTGMPRVPRYGFDHFRLANHIDDLTHGFIGGNGIDHIIDMVGMRACAVPPLPQLAATGVAVNYTCPVPAATESKKHSIKPQND